MKENVLEVLMFLYDHYLCEGAFQADERAMASELQQAGFDLGDITQAFDWLGELAGMQAKKLGLREISPHSARILNSEEQNKLDIECRSFMEQLEAMGMLDPRTREIILDRAMAIPVDRLSLTAFKKIVGFVLLHHPRYDEMLAWIDTLIAAEDLNTVH